jgi:hypothetical protein
VSKVSGKVEVQIGNIKWRLSLWVRLRDGDAKGFTKFRLAEVGRHKRGVGTLCHCENQAVNVTDLNLETLTYPINPGSAFEVRHWLEWNQRRACHKLAQEQPLAIIARPREQFHENRLGIVNVIACRKATEQERLPIAEKVDPDRSVRE